MQIIGLRTYIYACGQSTSWSACAPAHSVLELRCPLFCIKGYHRPLSGHWNFQVGLHRCPGCSRATLSAYDRGCIKLRIKLRILFQISLQTHSYIHNCQNVLKRIAIMLGCLNRYKYSTIFISDERLTHFQYRWLFIFNICNHVKVLLF